MACVCCIIDKIYKKKLILSHKLSFHLFCIFIIPNFDKKERKHTIFVCKVYINCTFMNWLTDFIENGPFLSFFGCVVKNYCEKSSALLSFIFFPIHHWICRKVFSIFCLWYYVSVLCLWDYETTEFQEYVNWWQNCKGKTQFFVACFAVVCRLCGVCIIGITFFIHSFNFFLVNEVQNLFSSVSI